MKVIHPNSIEIERKPKLPRTRQTPRELIASLVKINDEHIHYVKSEVDHVNLIRCTLHPFVQAVHLAYSQHLPVKISPDMIWYVIASGIAQHVNKNAEKLRNKFVDNDDQNVILIKRDNLLHGWHEVIDDFSDILAELTHKDVAETFEANFSTTTKDSKLVSQIVLMDTMPKYCDFRYVTRCGIPEIRVSGTKEDWLSVQEKARKIMDMIPELKKWLENGLNEILQNFVNLFEPGVEVDNKFWNEIYKFSGASGGPFISGWLVALFPYLKEGVQSDYVWKASWRDSIKGSFTGITTDSFDYHMNQLPFLWENQGKENKMLFVGGLIGIMVEKDNNLIPVFGYAFTEDKVHYSEPELQH